LYHASITGGSQDQFWLFDDEAKFLDPYTLNGTGFWFITSNFPVWGKTKPVLAISSDPNRPPDQEFEEAEDWVYVPVFWLPM
jgi:hypothetical protein